MTTNATVIGGLDDRTLLDAATRLATDERRATAALLRVLMEVDRRRLYLGEGCASMFSYCTQVLHLAEGAAYNRIEAARAARSYPVILELFEQSAITLTGVRLLAPHLTTDNHAAVLASATHKSKRQIEELVRDSGRCAFVGSHGRCAETAFLEFHHVEPYAAGGEATVQNIELRCRAHNAYEARLFFGDDVVREKQACWE